MSVANTLNPRWQDFDSAEPPRPAGAVATTDTLAVVLEYVLNSFDEEPVAPVVDGLSRRVVELYAEIATRHAIVREVDPGVFVARVHGLDGAWADGDTPEEALAALPEAIAEWVVVKRRLGAGPIPPMEGLDLNVA